MEILIVLLLIGIFIETTYLIVDNNDITIHKKKRIYLDTSIIIDGRILKIAKTGFIKNNMIIPRGVLRELQLLADSKDAEKRNRARAGLDTVNELERVIFFNIKILDDSKLGIDKVDDELLFLAKENGGVILTLDYNLIKRASAENVDTLNINELSLALRGEFIPGEKFEVKITGKGTNKGQGVGHLQDGTMIVVDRAANKIGETLEVEFVKFHETPAGKMAFAKIASPTKK